MPTESPLNTPLQLTEYALTQTNTSRTELFEGDDAFNSWAVSTVNLLGTRFYSELIKRGGDAGYNTDTETHDLIGQSREGAYKSAFPFLESSARIAKILVQYTDNDEGVVANFIAPEEITVDFQTMNQTVPQSNPLYTLIGGLVYLFPSPENGIVIDRGITLFKTLPFNQITSVSESLSSIPGQYRYVLVSGVISHLYMLKGDTSLADYHERKFTREISEAVSSLSGRETREHRARSRSSLYV